jgi:hypothetical protein
VKGLWIPSVLRDLEAAGVSVDRNARREMNAAELFVEHARTARSLILRHLVPRRLQHQVKSLFSRNDYAQKSSKWG